MVVSKINNSIPTPLLFAAFSAAVGYYFLASAPFAFCVFILAVCLAALCLFMVLASRGVFASFGGRNRSSRLMFARCAAASVGLVLGICASLAGHNEVYFAIGVDRVTAVEGVLLEDPRATSNGNAVASLSLRRCAGEGGLRATANGEITVFFPSASAARLKEFGRGATVFAEGNLTSSSYQGTGWTLSARSAHIVKPAPSIEKARTGIRQGLADRFDGKKWGGLALAMLVGVRDNLDTNFTAVYREAGLSYILALSGMHLAVFTALIAFILRKPLGLKASVIAGAVIISLYCFIVGPMPSLNRAALMYLLGALAVLGALPKKSMSILALSFLVQIVITPSAGNTISFILSYLAMLGILIIAKALVSLFSGKVPDFILRPLAVSCGAFLATAGVCCYTFGYIAPAGIAASLLIVPATSVFMIGSIFYLALDAVSLSGILNWPLSLLYQMMEKTAALAGMVPGITGAKPFIILTISVVLSMFIVVFEYARRASRLTLQPFG